MKPRPTSRFEKMTARAKILIVDDEPFNIDYLEQELEDQGYENRQLHQRTGGARPGRGGVPRSDSAGCDDVGYG